MAGWLSAVTGWDVGVEELMITGERIFNLKRMFNVREGISRKDDTLPPRILAWARGTGGAATNLPHLGKMLYEYYKLRGVVGGRDTGGGHAGTAWAGANRRGLQVDGVHTLKYS